MSENTENLSTPRLLIRSAIRLGIGVLLLASTLFLSRGSFAWAMAWVYLGLLVAGMSVTTLLLARVHPDLLVERSHIGEGAKPWDKLLAWLMALGILLPTLILAGLDRRWDWTPEPPLGAEIGGAVLYLLGASWICWAMVSNRFFAPIVRIQTDRGHKVAMAGPYRIVRHPGYVGIVVCSLTVPLLLGSLWAFAPAVLQIGVTVLRTTLEDRTLQNELEGYKEYAAQVRYWLLPGVW